MSEIGKFMLDYQKQLADQYNYRKLSDTLALDSMRKYVLSLPEGFHLNDNSIPVANNPEIDFAVGKPGFEIKKPPFTLLSRHETMIACSFDRIVIGHYGAFIEIDEKDMYTNKIKCEEGQEWRIKSLKYRDKVKYHWFTTKDNSHCKIYYQQKEVYYADYLVNKWYISPFEVLNRDELMQVLMREEEGEEYE
jgi:hypothetical protein